MRKLMFVLIAAAMCSTGAPAVSVHAADLNVASKQARPMKVRAHRGKVAYDPCMRTRVYGSPGDVFYVPGNLIYIPGHFDRRAGCIDGDIGPLYTLWPW